MRSGRKTKTMMYQDSNKSMCETPASGANVSKRKDFSLTGNENRLIAVALIPIAVTMGQFAFLRFVRMFQFYENWYEYPHIARIASSITSVAIFCTPLLLAFVVQNKATQKVLLVVGIALVLFRIWALVD
jgi:hypothetical protein